MTIGMWLGDHPGLGCRMQGKFDKAIADYTGALSENGASGSERIQPADQNGLDDQRDPPLGLPVNDFFQSTLLETTVARMRKNNSFIAEHNLVDDVAK